MSQRILSRHLARDARRVVNGRALYWRSFGIGEPSGVEGPVGVVVDPVVVGIQMKVRGCAGDVSIRATGRAVDEGASDTLALGHSSFGVTHDVAIGAPIVQDAVDELMLA